MMTERIINRLMSWIVIKKKRKTEEKKQENDSCILFWSGVMFSSHFYVVYIYLSKWHRKKKTLQPKIIKSKNMNIKKDCLSGIIINYLKEKKTSLLSLSLISLLFVGCRTSSLICSHTHLRLVSKTKFFDVIHSLLSLVLWTIIFTFWIGSCALRNIRGSCRVTYHLT